MAKRRAPNSIEAAVVKAKDILGARHCAGILELSESMVYKMSDTEHAEKLTLGRALKLDEACYEKKVRAPFHEFYAARIERMKMPDTWLKEDCNSQVLKMIKQIGDVAHALTEYSHANSRGGKELTPSEKSHLAVLAGDLCHKTKIFIECLETDTKGNANESR